MTNIAPLAIQYLMKKRAVTNRDLVNFVNTINSEGDKVELSSLLEQIKVRLSALNLTMEIVRCELTGVKYFVLLSTVERKYFSEYPLLPKVEEDCLYSLVNEIVSNGGEPLGSNDATINLVGLNHQVSPDRASQILNSFVSKKLLVETKNGCYCLGPLVLTELKQYLSSLGSVKTCAICTKEVVLSKCCRSCEADMHTYCFKEAQTDKSSHHCPLCNK